MSSSFAVLPIVNLKSMAHLLFWNIEERMHRGRIQSNGTDSLRQYSRV